MNSLGWKLSKRAQCFDWWYAILAKWRISKRFYKINLKNSTWFFVS